jgi:hypothetical protein
MYQAFPGGDGDWEQADAPVPRSMRRAVWLMYAGAVVSIASAGLAATAIHRLVAVSISVRPALRSAAASVPGRAAVDVTISVGLALVAMPKYGRIHCDQVR